MKVPTRQTLLCVCNKYYLNPIKFIVQMSTTNIIFYCYSKYCEIKLQLNVYTTLIFTGFLMRIKITRIMSVLFCKFDFKNIQ